MPVKRKRTSSSDKLFRSLFRERGAVDALIREPMRAETVREFRGAPEVLPGSFIDQALREHVTDVLARLRLRGHRSASVYFLLDGSLALAARSLEAVFRAEKTNRRSLVEDRRRQRSST